MSDGKYDAYLWWRRWPAAPQWSDLFEATEPVRRTLSTPQQEANALEHRDLGDEDQPSIHHSIHFEQQALANATDPTDWRDEPEFMRLRQAWYAIEFEDKRQVAEKSARIATLEAQVAQLRAAIEVLQAATPQKPAPQSEQFPANALRHAPKATIP